MKPIKVIISLVILVFSSFGVFAENKVFDKLDDFTSNIKLTAQNKIFSATGTGRVYSKEVFYIEPDATYNLKITAKKKQGSPDFLCHIGFVLYDEGMVELQPVFYRAEYNTECKLQENVKANSNVIVVNKPKYFPKDILKRYWYVAFDIKPNHQDLPNRNVLAIKKVEELSDNKVKITLQGKIIKDYPVNSPVRFHSPGPLMYSLINGQRLDYNWKNYSVNVKGISKHQGLKTFWKDAAFMKIVIVNSARTLDRNLLMEYKDLVLTTTKK